MPDMFFRDGSQFRKAKEVHFRDGTDWRKAQEVHVHNGAGWQKVYQGFTVSPPAFNPAAYPTYDDYGADAYGYSLVWLYTDGSAAQESYRNDGANQQDYTYTSTSWATPSLSGIGASYWARLRMTNAYYPNGGVAYNTWFQLNTSLWWSWVSYGGGSPGVDIAANFYIDISPDGGSNYVSTFGAAYVLWEYTE
jgi:hypothetical protein